MRRRGILNEPDYERQYLTFVALESGTFTLTIGQNVPASVLASVSYSLDGGNTWTTTENVDSQQVVITTPTITAGGKVLWKGAGTGVSVTTAKSQADRPKTSSIFSSTGKFDIQGNLMSLIKGDSFYRNDTFASGTSYNFALLFYCGADNLLPQYAKVVSIKNMIFPTGSTDYCYFRMFQKSPELKEAGVIGREGAVGAYSHAQMFAGCASLTTALELPATTLGNYCYHYMFYGCTSLTEAPELPATTLAEGCYYQMFYGCTSLTTAQQLPATTLATYCYNYMFKGCTNLTEAPELPATTLANYCYDSMFHNCTSLTEAPELPAMTLADFCYRYMFWGCTSLTKAPELPATTLARYCYLLMFKDCTSLTEVPDLPATTLTTWCYGQMFDGCTSLTTAPKLPATTLTDSCYRSMFQGCTNLSLVYCLATNISATNSTTQWLDGVASSGTFIKNPSMSSWPTGSNGIPSGWTVSSTTLFNPDISLSPTGYVTFTANQPNSTIGLAKKSTYQTMYISKNGTLWQEINGGDLFLMENIGDSYYVCGMLSGNNTTSNYSQFFIVGSVAASGNCNALWNYTNLNAQLREHCGYRLFYDCTSLTTAPVLPAMTLEGRCYRQMFYNCTSLTTAPQLPATTLAQTCYGQMFYNCTSLTTAPQLPATTLAQTCYYQMFCGCTSLTTVPQLPATTLVSSCYYAMFKDCTSLATAPELPATTLATYCYYEMFSNCTSLTTAPSELPATTLAKYCYNYMFKGCTNLTEAPELPATTLAQSCYNGMFQDCTSLTEAPELPATTLASYCYYYMFSNCTSLTTAPELPATTLADYCYSRMFSNTNVLPDCTNIDFSSQSVVASGGLKGLFAGTKITDAQLDAILKEQGINDYSLPVTTLAVDCYTAMFYGCTSLTTAPQLPATTLAGGCYYQMFYGCTNLNFVYCPATDISAVSSTSQWLDGVASSGTFIKNSSMSSWPTGNNGIPSGWEVKDEGFLQHLTFEALESGTFTINLPNELNTTLVKSVSYSLDNGETWVTTQNVNNQQVSITTPTISSGGTVRWKGDAVSFDGSVSIQSTGRFNASGNIMSMFFGDDFSDKRTIPESSALMFFFNSSKIGDASALYLPATTLANNCYYGMFDGCTNLTTAPELPATTLADYCYDSMFYGCTNLTEAPELLATTLASGCYNSMFLGCTSLTEAPELSATTLAQDCYQDMFENCTSLISAPELPATTLADGCYYLMFSGCTSLTTVSSVLPATTLGTWCYGFMFSGCTNLTEAPELPATTLTEGCYSHMFEDCISLTTVSALSARELADRCYSGMFYGCSNLSSIVCKATDISATGCTENWVSGVAASGTFKKAKNMEDWTTGVSGIPSGWTVEEGGGGSENLRLWLDDFRFMENYTMQDFIDDPESCGSNGYENIDESIEIDGDEFYLFETTSGNFSEGWYALLTDDDEDVLNGQAMVNNPLATFSAFYALLGEDRESVYEPSTVQLLKYDSENRVIWIDDFWNDYNLIDWYNGDVDSMPAWFDYKGETFELDGDEYYLWENVGEYDWDYSRAFLLTDTIDYDELVSQSLVEDVAATPTSIICYLSEDQEETYSGDDQLLIRVEDLDA